MFDKEELNATFTQALLGVMIGWGGFSTLFPNLIEGLSGFVQLGNSKALRVFSMVFFIAPIYFFILYWWIRGRRLYIRHVTGKKVADSIKYTYWGIGFFLANCVPIVAFLVREFYVDTIVLGVDVIIVISTGLTIAQFWVITYLKPDGKISFSKTEDPRVIMANFLVFTLQFAIGVTLAFFIEPWMLYKDQIFYLILGSFAIYVLIGGWVYFATRMNKQEQINYRYLWISSFGLFFVLLNLPFVAREVLGDVKVGALPAFLLPLLLLLIPSHLTRTMLAEKKVRIRLGIMALLLATMAFGAAVYSKPLSIFDWWVVGTVSAQIADISIATLGILTFILLIIVVQQKWAKLSDPTLSSKRLITIVGTGAVAIILQLTVFDRLLYKSNLNYLQSRFESHELISSNKIMPFVFMADDEKASKVKQHLVSKSENTGNDWSLVRDSELADFIYENNHHLAAVMKNRASDTAKVLFEPRGRPQLQIDLREIVKEMPDASVRYFYFKTYIDRLEQEDTIHFRSQGSDRLDRAIESLGREKALSKHFASQKSISDFYHVHYDYIENYVIKALDNEDHEDYSLYFHPINYYTRTLNHYHDEFTQAQKMDELYNRHAIVAGMSLDTTLNIVNDLQQDIMQRLAGLVEYSDKVESIEIPDTENTIFSLKHPLNKRLWHSQEEKEDPMFEHLVELKGAQYIERYERAQTIFASFLLDIQRPGVFLFIFSLVVFGMLNWIHKDVPAPKKEEDESSEKSKKTAPDELPGGFLNIAVIVVLVLCIHIARPIQKESINPQKPYWMMDLNNWYDASGFAKMLGAEDAVMAVQNRYAGPAENAELNQVIMELRKSNKDLIQANEDIRSVLEALQVRSDSQVRRLENIMDNL